MSAATSIRRAVRYGWPKGATSAFTAITDRASASASSALPSISALLTRARRSLAQTSPAGNPARPIWLYLRLTFLVGFVSEVDGNCSSAFHVGGRSATLSDPGRLRSGASPAIPGPSAGDQPPDQDQEEKQWPRCRDVVHPVPRTLPDENGHPRQVAADDDQQDHTHASAGKKADGHGDEKQSPGQLQVVHPMPGRSYNGADVPGRTDEGTKKNEAERSRPTGRATPGPDRRHGGTTESVRRVAQHADCTPRSGPELGIVQDGGQLGHPFLVPLLPHILR